MHVQDDGAPTYAPALTIADKASRQRISQQRPLRMQAHFAAEGRVSTFLSFTLPFATALSDFRINGPQQPLGRRSWL
jgi:hypothetical protein